VRHIRLRHSTIDLSKRRPASNIHNIEENNVDDLTEVENHVASTSMSLIHKHKHYLRVLILKLGLLIPPKPTLFAPMYLPINKKKMLTTN